MNELLREIVAEEIESVDDERLEMVTVTALECEPDLRHATVFVSTLSSVDDTELLEALEEQRRSVQASIGRQARLKRVPELTFRVDETARSAQRIEDILRDLGPTQPSSDP